MPHFKIAGLDNRLELFKSQTNENILYMLFAPNQCFLSAVWVFIAFYVPLKITFKHQICGTSLQKVFINKVE